MINNARLNCHGLVCDLLSKFKELRVACGRKTEPKLMTPASWALQPVGDSSGPQWESLVLSGDSCSSGHSVETAPHSMWLHHSFGNPSYPAFQFLLTMCACVQDSERMALSTCPESCKGPPRLGPAASALPFLIFSEPPRRCPPLLSTLSQGDT